MRVGDEISISMYQFWLARNMVSTYNIWRLPKIDGGGVHTQSKRLARCGSIVPVIAGDARPVLTVICRWGEEKSLKPRITPFAGKNIPSDVRWQLIELSSKQEMKINTELRAGFKFERRARTNQSYFCVSRYPSNSTNADFSRHVWHLARGKVARNARSG